MTRRHDFPEDFKHENEVYQNTCCECKEIFLGYNGRLMCAVCETVAMESHDEIESRVRRDVTSPFFSKGDQLEIAIGSAIFKEKVICNLRQQIKNLQQLLFQSEVDGIIIEQHQYKHLQESNDD